MPIHKQQLVPAILVGLAGRLNAVIKNNRLEVPRKFGRGYCKGYVFNKEMRMMISNYELKKDLIIENPEAKTPGRMIFFKFQNVISQKEFIPVQKVINTVPSVLIATSRMNTDDTISIHSNIATINIEIDSNYLANLIVAPKRSKLLKSLLENKQPLLFDQIIYPSLQKVVDEIVGSNIEKSFELFFLRIKAEELICRLLMELTQREDSNIYPLNNHDVQTIYSIKDKILLRLEHPPSIHELAVDAGMSTTKLKRLFKQIFGNSIYSYYQEFRMKEAARLLREEQWSVAQSGYHMGFSNLSHFSRVFKAHLGMKPKEYSKGFVRKRE